MNTLIMMITLPAICQYIPQTDFEACNPPPITEMCFSVTSYWPFDDGVLTPYGGQADSDPTKTANGFKITGEHQANTFVASSLPFVGQEFCNSWLGCVPIHDTFGDPTYQAGPFWHDGYKQFVIPIDVFSPEPAHYLECSGEIK